MNSDRRANCRPTWPKRLARTLWWMCFASLVSNGSLIVVNASPDQPDQAEVEGAVEFIQPSASGPLELQLNSGTNRIALTIEHAGNSSPERFSWIRATGRWISHAPVSGQPPAASRLLVSGLGQIQLLTGSLVPVATNVAQLNRLGADGQLTYCVAALEGLVLAASPDNRWVLFEDDSGTAMLEMESPHQAVRTGQRVILAGNAAVQGTRIQLCNPPLVNNDGLHMMAERSGSMFLAAGRHAIRLSWFNLAEPHGLKVFYQGPDLPRQQIPDAALFHLETNAANGVSRWVQGLNYKCCEGNWFRVPDFTSLIPLKQGIIANFETGVIPRNPDVGLEFSGYLEVPRGGIYTFSTVSDDGSLLFIDGRPPRVEVTGTGVLPAPEIIAPGQILRADQPDQWAQVEGTVTFASRQAGTLELVLNSDTGKMIVKIMDGAGGASQLFLHSRVRVTGICPGSYTADGQIVAGTLLAPGLRQIEWLNVAPERWSDHPVVPVRDLARLDDPGSAETIVHVRGKVAAAQPDGTLLVADATGQVAVEALQP
ncbi:MAG TPA: PA14 domain-containing protein, partial [Verrucomicrobiae bacterium]|nr:PA14 domain-containing protein [Verrucomicrobiae bacterium]